MLSVVPIIKKTTDNIHTILYTYNQVNYKDNIHTILYTYIQENYKDNMHTILIIAVQYCMNVVFVVFLIIGVQYCKNVVCSSLDYRCTHTILYTYNQVNYKDNIHTILYTYIQENYKDNMHTSAGRSHEVRGPIGFITCEFHS
jgi:transposase